MPQPARRNPPPAARRAARTAADAAFVSGFPATLSPARRALLDTWARRTGRRLRYTRQGVEVPGLGGGKGRCCPPERIDEILSLARRQLARIREVDAAVEAGVFEGQMRRWAVGGPPPPWAQPGDLFPENVRARFTGAAFSTAP